MTTEQMIEKLNEAHKEDKTIISRGLGCMENWYRKFLLAFGAIKAYKHIDVVARDGECAYIIKNEKPEYILADNQEELERKIKMLEEKGLSVIKEKIPVMYPLILKAQRQIEDEYDRKEEIEKLKLQSLEVSLK